MEGQEPKRKEHHTITETTFSKLLELVSVFVIMIYMAYVVVRVSQRKRLTEQFRQRIYFSSQFRVREARWIHGGGRGSSHGGSIMGSLLTPL